MLGRGLRWSLSAGRLPSHPRTWKYLYILVRDQRGIHDTGTRSSLKMHLENLAYGLRQLGRYQLSRSVSSNGKRANRIVLCLLVADVMDFSGITNHGIHGNIRWNASELVLTAIRLAWRTLYTEYLALFDRFRSLRRWRSGKDSERFLLVPLLWIVLHSVPSPRFSVCFIVRRLVARET